MRWRFFSVKGQCRLRTSLCAKASSSPTISMPSGCSRGGRWLWAITRMPNALAKAAVSRPIWPRPMMPNVCPFSSVSGAFQKQNQGSQPRPLANRLGVGCHVLGQVEHVREDYLRYGRRGVGRDVRDRDATGTGGSEVDDVVAGGQHADVLEIGQAADALSIQHGFVGKHDLGIGCPLGDQPGRGTVVGLHLAKRFEEPSRGHRGWPCMHQG